MSIRTVRFTNGAEFTYNEYEQAEVDAVVNYFRNTPGIAILSNEVVEVAPTMSVAPPEPISHQIDARVYYYSNSELEAHLMDHQRQERENRRSREEKWRNVFNQLSETQRNIWNTHTDWNDTLTIYAEGRLTRLDERPIITIKKELAIDNPDAFFKAMDNAEQILKEKEMERIRQMGSNLTWVPVESSMIKAVAYDPHYFRRRNSSTPTGTLYVLFTKGGVWKYVNVSAYLYNRLLESESKGKYFNRYIKTDKHEATDLTPPLSVMHNSIEQDVQNLLDDLLEEL